MAEPVIPAEAGIHLSTKASGAMDACLRGGDDHMNSDCRIALESR